jgi:hypothetical protein
MLAETLLLAVSLLSTGLMAIRGLSTRPYDILLMGISVASTGPLVLLGLH